MDAEMDMDSNLLLCPACGIEIGELAKRPADNPLACPDCGTGLRIYRTSAGGKTWLNTWWAPFDSQLQCDLGALFGLARFDHKHGSGQATNWRHFEARHAQTQEQRDRIYQTAQALARSAPNLGQAAWGAIIASVEKRMDVSAVRASSDDGARHVERDKDGGVYL